MISVEDRVELIKKALKRHGSVKIKAKGDSMEPSIKDGEVVKIQRISYSEARIRDVLMYEKEGRIVIHRLLFKGKKHLVFKGDGNRFMDRVVYPKEVLGKVVTDEKWRKINLLYLMQSKVIEKELVKRRIKYLWLKGAPWQMKTFGYLFDYPVGDMDLLVEKEKYYEVRSLLIESGYEMKKLPWVKSEVYEDIERVSEVSFVNRKFGLVVDLHLKAIRSPSFPLFKKPIDEESMDRLSKYFLSSFDETDNLFYLCMNILFHHGGRGVEQMGYIAYLIDRGKVDWEKLSLLAVNYQVYNFFNLLLYSISRNFFIKISLPINFSGSLFITRFANLLLGSKLAFYPIDVNSYWSGRLNALNMLVLRILLTSSTQ